MKNTLLIFFIGMIFNSFGQNCVPSTATIDLEINNVRARIMNGGDMWWDGVSEPGYEYPKVGISTGPAIKHLMFGGGVWLSGLDDQGNLKMAAQTYRNQGHDFWPGPIAIGTSAIQDTECNKFDRFFNILRSDLDAHINMLSSSTLPLNTSNIHSSIIEWPGKGNQYLLNQYNMNIINDLAPFQDCNGNGTYEPENGDYPLMKGDQSVFWVINDLGNMHTRSSGAPLGVEIQCMAYAYITSDAVNDATFYDYTVVKRTSGNLNDFYFSQFVDSDLGDYSDDFIGCDTTLEYGFCYNADNNDGDFGSGPPIVVTQFLNSGSQGLSSFIGLANNTGPQGDPIDAPAFRNYQTGFWADGTPLTCGGNGFGGVTPTNFLYPGNPSTNAGGGDCENWSECSGGNFPNDRRYIMSSGPYTLTPAIPLEFTIAVIIAQTDYLSYNGCPDKTTIINPTVSLVGNFINNVNDNPYNCNMSNSIFEFNDSEKLLSIFPNPTNNILNIETKENFEISTIELYDATGSLIDVELNNYTLNLEGKAKGIYTLKIYSENSNKIVLKKFVLR